jgi:hypothetical protein
MCVTVGTSSKEIKFMPCFEHTCPFDKCLLVYKTSAARLYAAEFIEVVVRNVQHMYIMPCMNFYICSRQIQQALLKYRIIVNSGLRNIFIKMEVLSKDWKEP